MSQTAKLGVMMAVLGCGGCAAVQGARFDAAQPADGRSQQATLHGASPCRLVAPSRTVASHAFVPDGLEAERSGNEVTVRFARRKGRCLAATVRTESGEVVAVAGPAQCPSKDDDIVATSDGQTLVAHEVVAADGARIDLGLAAHDETSRLLGFRSHAPRSVDQAFVPLEGARGEKSAGLAPLGGDRFFLTWVDQNPDGHVLHARAVTASGSALGPVLDLSTADSSVLGRTSTVVGPDGQGIVAFFASGDRGFEVRAAPIACEAP